MKYDDAPTVLHTATNLTANELILYSRTVQAMRDSGEPDTRAAGIRHLERLAIEMTDDTSLRASMIANVLAFVDELVLATNRAVGSA